MWIQKHKGYLAAAVLILAVLTAAFFAGGGRPDEETSDGQSPSSAPAVTETADITASASENGDHPEPVNPEDAAMGEKAYTCTVSISCASILSAPEKLDSDKAELVPEDGWLFAPAEVTFYEGESVFNLLQRICRQNQIHMEYEDTPLYHSAYIEGIGNLYEFDAGELSGWMYRVNGWFPNYGCSRYQLEDGDRVEWLYTCDLGADIGGSVSDNIGQKPQE